MRFSYYNPSPIQARVGDCTVRAICKATGQDWERTYIDLCLQGLIMADMPSANHVWGAYLRAKGFRRCTLPHDIPDYYTVEDFCRDHQSGTYILALDGHAVAAQDGIYYDTWDCGSSPILFYWEKEA